MKMKSSKSNKSQFFPVFNAKKAEEELESTAHKQVTEKQGLLMHYCCVCVLRVTKQQLKITLSCKVR